MKSATKKLVVEKEMEVSSVKVSPSVDETTDTEDWNTGARTEGTVLEAIGTLSSPL